MEKKRLQLEFSIPEEILFEILLQLSVKSLLRCRAVSKQWRLLIDNPAFVDSHHIRSHTRPEGIHLISEYKQYCSQQIFQFNLFSKDPEGDSPIPFLTCNPIPCSYHYVDQLHYYDCVQSVHGLVHKDGTLYNTSTRESYALPSIKISMQVDVRVYEENKYKVVPQYFLGFDSITNTFKVLNVSHITLPRSKDRIELRVLTLGNNSWKILHVSNQFRISGIRHNMGICVDGVIFCSAYMYENHDIVDDFILAFEVGPEKFRLIHYPDNYEQMVNIGNRLALVDIAYIGELDEEEMITIWILEDYKNLVWKKMKSFKSPAMEIMRNQMDGFATKEICTKAMGTIHTNVSYSLQKVTIKNL